MGVPRSLDPRIGTVAVGLRVMFEVGQPVTCDGPSGSVSASGVFSPLLQLQWLLDNYETAEGVSLPRSSLYNHYLRHCQEHKLDP